MIYYVNKYTKRILHDTYFLFEGLALSIFLGLVAVFQFVDVVFVLRHQPLELFFTQRLSVNQHFPIELLSLCVQCL